MHRNVIVLLAFVILAVPAGAPAVAAPEQPENTSSEAYKLLETAVDRSRSQEGYHLSVEFHIDASDRQDTMDVVSMGVFRKPEFYLESITPSGMEVTSYGNDRAIAHIDPSTDQVVTSEKLGLASVNRKMLDPFKHFTYLLKPDYQGFRCGFDGTKKMDGRSHRVIRVQPGPDQIREVMNKFQDQLKRPIKPEKTRATYRIFVDEKKTLIRRVDLQVETKAPPEDDGAAGAAGEDGGDDPDLPPGIKEKLDEESKTNGEDDAAENRSSDGETGEEEGGADDASLVTITIDGRFELTRYNKGLGFTIPDDVRAKLKKWAKGSGSSTGEK